MKNSDIKKNCYFRIYNDHEESVIAELNSKNIKYSPYIGALQFKYAKVYKVDKYSDILDTQSFKDGDILIEDASSIYLTDKLADLIKIREKKIKDLSSNETISMIKLLDACASPGGKILGLIDLIYADYFYFYAEARDISKEKIHKICENVNRLKVMDLNMNVIDASVYDKTYDDMYDVIICDVPCSGLGVIDKKPDIKLNFSEEKVKSLAKLQQQILNVHSHYVKTGGLLSYSTCTETDEENHDNIECFLKIHKDFSIIYEKQIKRGDECNSDGFYICILQRN